jgi:hypothetical protein
MRVSAVHMVSGTERWIIGIIILTLTTILERTSWRMILVAYYVRMFTK